MEMGGSETTMIRMFGVNREGHSVMAHIYNFRPYFYVKLPEQLPELTPTDFEDLKKAINLRDPNH